MQRDSMRCNEHIPSLLKWQLFFRRRLWNTAGVQSRAGSWYGDASIEMAKLWLNLKRYCISMYIIVYYIYTYKWCHCNLQYRFFQLRVLDVPPTSSWSPQSSYHSKSVRPWPQWPRHSAAKLDVSSILKAVEQATGRVEWSGKAVLSFLFFVAFFGFFMTKSLINWLVFVLPRIGGLFPST